MLSVKRFYEMVLTMRACSSCVGEFYSIDMKCEALARKHTIADGDAFRDQLTLPMYAVLNQYGADGWRLVGQSVTPSQCDPHDPHLLYFHLTFIREVD
jgi:hypothetical protein